MPHLYVIDSANFQVSRAVFYRPTMWTDVGPTEIKNLKYTANTKVNNKITLSLKIASKSLIANIIPSEAAPQTWMIQTISNAR